MSTSTNQIEREVEETRADLAQTANELRERLSVGQMVDEAGRMLRTSGGSDFLRNLGRQVADNPLPVLLIGVGMAWLMMSSSRGRHRTDQFEAHYEPYGALEAGSDVPIDETERLIASNKVEGTNVYNRQGEHLGYVYNFMIDKYSGQVAYAVMSFGGYLGIGERYHPLPWRALDYDTRMEGFVVDLDRSTLEGAPHYGADEDPWATDQNFGRSVYDYYDYHYD